MQARASFESKFESGPLAIQVLTDLPEIARLSDEWDALLARSICNRAFSSAQWFVASCSANPSFQPYVIIARKGAVLAGILPLVLIELKTSHKKLETAYNNNLRDYKVTVPQLFWYNALAVESLAT